MTQDDLAPTVAYCGLVCGLCPAYGQCAGCRHDGGDKGCAIRECAQTRGLAGCWECAEFPCRQAGMGSEDWRGFMIASIQSVRAHGLAETAERVAERGGRPGDFGLYRGVAAEEILRGWWGET
jgi:hypothetical protein